uniref:AlNc14C209G8882 protein n=1 Tax=Albugo laibachii Nc14 TaxID=890382 RepID=F0WR75_9STRA|nr:AlNc14C209G8882 [Albugo laibachii Nc14]|eukprot:CCA23836.1 AlNc14C209G8882 [Albugo laibachii Nc14]
MAPGRAKIGPKNRMMLITCVFLVVLCGVEAIASAKNATSPNLRALPKAPPLSEIPPELKKGNDIFSLTPEAIKANGKDSQRQSKSKQTLQSFGGAGESAGKPKTKFEDDADAEVTKPPSPVAAPPNPAPAVVVPPVLPVKAEDKGKSDSNVKPESESELEPNSDLSSESETKTPTSGKDDTVEEKVAAGSNTPKEETKFVEALAEPKSVEKTGLSWNLIMIIAAGGIAAILAALFIFAKVRNRDEAKVNSETPWSASDPEKKDYKGLDEKANYSYTSSHKTDSFDASYEAKGSDLDRFSQSLSIKDDQQTRESDSTSIFFQSTMASQTFSAASSDIYSDQDSVLSSKWNQARNQKSSFVAKDSLSGFSDFESTYSDHHSKDSYAHPDGSKARSNFDDSIAKLSDVESDWDDHSESSEMRDTDLSSFSHSNPPSRQRKNEFEV